MPIHPVEIKAQLKKRYGSVLAFERYRRLPPESVRDVLRGRSNVRVAHAIADELGLELHQILLDPNESRNRDDTEKFPEAHPQTRPDE